MADALNPDGEPPSARNAPTVIYLPYLPPPEIAKKQPRRQRPLLRRARFSPEEAEEFDRRATAAGLSDGAFIRISTIGESGRPRSQRRPPTVDSRERARAVAALNHIGGNLNQGFRALNEIKLAAPEEISRDRLADELAALRELFETGMAALITALEVLRGASCGDVREG
jgi:hypothetical protein